MYYIYLTQKFNLLLIHINTHRIKFRIFRTLGEMLCLFNVFNYFLDSDY